MHWKGEEGWKQMATPAGGFVCNTNFFPLYTSLLSPALHRADEIVVKFHPL